MLLAVDIGNTNIVLGIFEGEDLTQSWRLATLQDRTADELRVPLRVSDFDILRCTMLLKSYIYLLIKSKKKECAWLHIVFIYFYIIFIGRILLILFHEQF